MRNNQSKLYAKLYQGILDTINADKSSTSMDGRWIVSPPFVIGRPRDIKKRYLNEMALVQRYGKPDVFYTITCNPN